MSKNLNLLLYPERENVVAEVMRSTDSLFLDALSELGKTDEGRVLLELLSVKKSHGEARREALQNLDRVVTELFPPVEGAPLPSEELNGKADVLEGSFIGYHHDYANNTFGLGIFPSFSGSSLAGASAPFYCDGPAEPSYIPIPPMFNRTKK